MKEISHTFIARLTQIDYDREMALVATDRDPTSSAPPASSPNPTTRRRNTP